MDLCRTGGSSKEVAERNPVQNTEKLSENNPKRERGLINTLGEANLNINLSETGYFIQKKVLPSLNGVYIVRVTIGLRSVKIFSVHLRGRKY